MHSLQLSSWCELSCNAVFGEGQDKGGSAEGDAKGSWAGSGGPALPGPAFQTAPGGLSSKAAAYLDCLVERHLCWHVYLSRCTALATRQLSQSCFFEGKDLFLSPGWVYK